MAYNASHAIASTATVRPIFNVEEEVVVIRNGWPSKKKTLDKGSMSTPAFPEFFSSLDTIDLSIFAYRLYSDFAFTDIVHLFADDLQLLMSAPPDETSEQCHYMQSNMSDIKALATAKMNTFSDSKTKLMLVTSKSIKNLHSLPTSITFRYAQIPFK